MNSVQLQSLMMEDNNTRIVFRGVMPSDVFAELYDEYTNRHPTSLFIVNTDASNKEGSHWVSVWRQDGITHFFDPFGAPAELYPTIYPTLQHHSPVSGLFPLQSSKTNVCGDFCVVYCLAVTRGVDPVDFSQYWMNIGEKREELVRLLIEEMLEYSLMKR